MLDRLRLQLLSDLRIPVSSERGVCQVHQVLPLDPPRSRRSYTLHTEGEIPAIVMEFLSDTDGGEYSIRPHPPYGKLWFYERILQVPLTSFLSRTLER